MMEQTFSNMTGKILIASPYAMQGNVFHKSLIYVVHHGDDGSIGLIFNHTVNNVSIDKLFKKIDLKVDSSTLNLDVHIGGPVELERGFFLHSGEYSKNLLFQSTGNNLAVSSNTEILQDIAQGIGPMDTLFIVGYTGWKPGQMEFELENNLWIISEPDRNLIFNTEVNQWDLALKQLGINNSDFYPTPGKC
ncbi:MAG: YqgE/AlgH family protein [Rickettsiaceae bacterium]|nr:YqgE/AlgH family protein [Rickettsiaceae bacterium]